MSNRPKFQLFLGLNDLKTANSKVNDNRYIGNDLSDLEEIDLHKKDIDNIKSLSEDHKIAASVYKNNVHRLHDCTLGALVQWDAEHGLASVVGVPVSAGLYAQDELYALAYGFDQFGCAGFKELSLGYFPMMKEYQLLVHELFKLAQFNIQKEDLKLFLYWKHS